MTFSAWYHRQLEHVSNQGHLSELNDESQLKSPSILNIRYPSLIEDLTLLSWIGFGLVSIVEFPAN